MVLSNIPKNFVGSGLKDLICYACMFPCMFCFAIDVLYGCFVSILYVCMYVCMYVSIYLSIYLSMYLSIYLSIYIYVYVCIYVYVYLYVCILGIYTSNFDVCVTIEKKSMF